MLLLGVKSKIDWIEALASVPVLGSFFVFIMIFVPAVICSFIAHAYIPYLNDDPGFTKAMLVLLPASNAIMWFYGIRLYIFFLPSWLLLGVVALIKFILLLNGVEP